VVEKGHFVGRVLQPAELALTFAPSAAEEGFDLFGRISIEKISFDHD
jgi:hypothetical protein